MTYPSEEQIYYVEEGAGTLLYGDEMAPIRADDFMYLPPGMRHGIANSSTAPVKVILPLPVFTVRLPSVPVV